MLRRAQALGASHLATGHYAQITENNTLMQAVDQQKDQSYFLFPITPNALSKTLFPLGGMTKAEVRAHAERLGLVTAKKPESQDVCFIPDNDHTSFIDRYRPEQEGKGNIVLEDGTVVGQHDGFWKYTVGQRKGLGVAMGERQYVLDIDASTNTVVIGSNESLFHRSLSATRVNWFRKPVLRRRVDCAHPTQRISSSLHDRGARPIGCAFSRTSSSHYTWTNCGFVLGNRGLPEVG